MRKAKFENRLEVSTCVRAVGWGFFLTVGAKEEDMPDEETRKAFAKARKALIAFGGLLPDAREADAPI